MPSSFAVIHTWPELKNAEYEVLQRLLAAAKRVNVSTVVIDNNAKVLWSSPDLGLREGMFLPEDSVDFAISLHFESAKLVDLYSYITLWQPIDFYHHFGYQTSIDKLTSHNDLISCASDLADEHGLNLMEGLGRVPLLPLPRMFHSVPEPFLEPRISAQSRLFYIGINWERVGRPVGRFHEVIKALDDKDLTDIYGPEMLLGVVPWAGFRTYRGELPFDGEAVRNAINRSGICLALSSAAHKHVGIMSNRLFEGLAGGAAIIASPNAIVDKYFRDAVYLVDDTRGEAVLTQQIIEAVRRIWMDPEEATRRTLAGQQIVREECSLEDSIRMLVAETPRRMAHFAESAYADAEISVICSLPEIDIDTLKRHLDQFVRQKRSVIDVHLICGEQTVRRHGAEIAAFACGSVRKIVVHATPLDPMPNSFDGERPVRARSGQITATILDAIDTPYFAFSRLDDLIFSGHFATLAKALKDQSSAMAACSGMIVQTSGVDGSRARVFDSARFVDFDALVLVNGTGQVGRFVFRSDLLKASFGHLMPMLDGEEHSYFKLAAYLAGPLAQSGHATYVQDQTASAQLPFAVEPVDHQRQYIRDLFSRDPRWLDRLNKGGKIPEFVYARTPGVPLRWDQYTPPHAVTHQIPLDRLLETKRGGEGVHYLIAGFPSPEPLFTWLESDRGVIDFSIASNDVWSFDNYEFVLRASGRHSLETGREQHCTIAVDGMVVAYANVPEAETELRFRIPLRFITRSRLIRVEIIPDHADVVFDVTGTVIDPRRLSLRVSAIGVFRVFLVKPPIFSAGLIHPCGIGERGAEALFKGFYASEEHFVWMAGTKGQLRFALHETPKSPRLVLRLFGRPSLATGMPQKVKITVNDVAAGEYVVGHNPSNIFIEPPTPDSGRTWYIEIEGSHAEAVFDEHHNIVDNRLLGVAVCAIGVIEAEPRGFDTVHEHADLLRHASPPYEENDKE